MPVSCAKEQAHGFGFQAYAETLEALLGFEVGIEHQLVFTVYIGFLHPGEFGVIVQGAELLDALVILWGLIHELVAGDINYFQSLLMILLILLFLLQIIRHAHYEGHKLLPLFRAEALQGLLPVLCDGEGEFFHGGFPFGCEPYGVAPLPACLPADDALLFQAGEGAGDGPCWCIILTPMV